MTVPVPLGLVNAHRHRSDHRVQHATVVAAPHKIVTPAKPIRPQAPHVTAPSAGHKPGLMFRVTHAGTVTSVAGRHHHARPVARAAGDPGDTISDFKFTPASITVHVGDTVTWTNNGPTEHTATASNGSFDTGLLQKGQSASHTFTQAGTIAYICSIHPFMHGTVVVLASSSSSGSGSNPGSGSGTGGGSGSGSGSTPTATTASSTGGTAATQSSGSTLPNTGLDLGGTLGAGLLLIGMGAALSRRTRSAGTDQ